MTPKEVAQYLRVSERTVLDWAVKGEIPSGKLGSSWRFKRSELEAWLDQRLSSRSDPVRAGATDVKSTLTPDRVLFLPPGNKEQALRRLISCLSTSPEVTHPDELSEAVFWREGLMSTGIGFGVAVPHVRIESVTRLVMAAAKSSTRIDDYESLDEAPIHLVFLVAASHREHGEYLQLLSRLSGDLKDCVLRQRLIEAPDEATFFDTLVTGS
jgi:PTS system nitrogen regulatory IIA component